MFVESDSVFFFVLDLPVNLLTTYPSFPITKNQVFLCCSWDPIREDVRFKQETFGEKWPPFKKKWPTYICMM